MSYDVKPITVDRIVAFLQRELAAETAAVHVHDTIAALIREKWEGKKFNKRFIAQLRERLGYPESVAMFWDGGHGSLAIWGKDSPWPDYNRRRTFYVASGGFPPTNPAHKGHWQGAMHAEGYEYQDCANGSGARSRNGRRQWLLEDPPRLARIAATAQAAVDAWRALEALCDNPDVDGASLGYKLVNWTGLNNHRSNTIED